MSQRRKPAPGERLYRILLRLYPAGFRQRYGDDLLAFYRLRVDAARGSLAAFVRAWLRILADLLVSAAAERLPRQGAKRYSHDSPPEARMSVLLQDVRYALRNMAHHPLFTAIVLATLALGIGANAAIFTVVDAVLLRPLPYAHVDRIVQLTHNDSYGTVSEPEFVDYQRGVTSLSALAAWSGQSAIVGASGEPVTADGARVSRDFFSILGVPAEAGRSFAADEFSPRATARVVMISHALWMQQFGGRSSVIGSALELDGVKSTIVGVMPAGFEFPGRAIAFWTPWRMNPDSLWTRNNHYLRVIGLLAPGATVARAAAEARTLDARWMRAFPETYRPSKPISATLTPLTDVLLGATRPYLIALIGAVGFVLLIACVNVANLLLARGESRRKELAVRAALGASDSRLIRLVLTESLVLATLGAVLGAALAWAGVHLLLSIAPNELPRIEHASVDWRVVAYTLVVVLATGGLIGIVPALRGRGQGSAEVLRDGTRDSALGLSVVARRGLVIAEVALAVVTLSGSGLLMRSLSRLRAIDLGFKPDHVLAMDVTLPANAYSDTTADQRFAELLAQVGAVPGVEHAALNGAPPISGNDNGWSIMLDGRVVRTTADAPFARPEQVTADYFRVMSIPLRSGRFFTAQDRMGAPPVVIVSASMAKAMWPGVNPIGRTLKLFKAPQWVTVVGVVGDVRSRGYQRDVPNTMYFPYSQTGMSAYYMPRAMTLLVAGRGEPEALASAVRNIVRAQDPRIAISNVATMDRVVGDSIASRRFTTSLFIGFAALALVLAGVGIYGVISYGVSQRTYEIGVRMALGASASAVMRMVLGEGARMACIGLAAGLAGAFAVDRALRSLLVGIGIADVPTAIGVSVTLISVAALACGMPARRATKVSPTEALRAAN